MIEMIIGYEWFMSGLVKILRGDFTSGLAEEVLKKVPETATWYGGFLRSVVVPNATLFAYVIEIAEVLAGLVLIVGPIIWLFAWDRVSDRVRRVILFFIAFATIGGAVLTVNLHLFNNGSHPWLIPKDSFDEGVDLDSVLPALQIVIAAVSIVLFRRLGRARTIVARTEL